MPAYSPKPTRSKVSVPSIPVKVFLMLTMSIPCQCAMCRKKRMGSTAGASMM